MTRRFPLLEDMFHFMFSTQVSSQRTSSSVLTGSYRQAGSQTGSRWIVGLRHLSRVLTKRDSWEQRLENNTVAVDCSYGLYRNRCLWNQI